ncbi:MAG: YvcK family protein [Candidatus Roizmanbacteria bacterium]|nr:YvcK family protein [Candidatus Roizmanbacteria bacterium]MCR4312780.1 YvcK family protein [Candidatus Roizmanbacteria bacterium]
MKKITVIGGGTGTFVVLSGLKKYPLDLSVVVTMMDSGGSTGRLRDQLGILPPGDLRQCLVALSDAPLLWRKLFLYRFEKGDLEGHNFGNIFLAALEKVSDSYDNAIDTASYVLKTKGKVIPVTFNKLHLVAEYENGQKITGEGLIDENHSEKSRIKTAYLEPQGNANPVAIKSIEESEYIVIGPGDLYTSIIPVLLVNDVKEAMKKSKAKIIYIMNMMTKSGQTTNYKASDHVKDLVKYLGKEPDYILINNGAISEEILASYKKYNEVKVANDLNKNGYQIIEKDLVDVKKVEKNSSDILYRSILRHDSEKVAGELKKIFYV